MPLTAIAALIASEDVIAAVKPLQIPRCGLVVTDENARRYGTPVYTFISPFGGILRARMGLHGVSGTAILTAAAMAFFRKAVASRAPPMAAQDHPGRS
jgi:hypothetical protein